MIALIILYILLFIFFLIFITLFLKNDYRIETAVDSNEAFKKIKHEKFSAILMDVSLGGGLGGLELSQEIRTIHGYEKIPIIALTAHSFREDVNEILNSGCTHYIPKPVNKNVLIETLEKALNINRPVRK